MNVFGSDEKYETEEDTNTAIKMQLKTRRGGYIL
jgi:hypothetical protein